MPDVPSGTATLLFTDVEGSTRLLKGLRERYSDVLAEHQQILREAFAAHGGEVVDTQGDSFFAAFRRAQDAVLAAAEAQRALAAHSWPEGGELRVRMGIHTGQVSVSGNRYLGVAVHRAARICAVGHGGQVLVSQTTKALLEDEEVELTALEFRDLGEQRLKDLDRPIRLFQLVGDGLPDAFAPLTPVEHPPFAGREEELAQTAAAALRRRRLPRRSLLIAAVALVLVVPPVVVVLANRSGADKPVTVGANSVAVIDPRTDSVVGDVAVGTEPAQIAYGDGSVWVANRRDTTLSRISTDTLEASSPVGIQATEITDVAAGLGSVWIAAGIDGTVLRFDPAANRVLATIGMPHLKHAGLGGPSYIHAVAIGEGGVWALDETQTAAFRIDPQRQAVDLTVPEAVGEAVHGFGGGLTGDPERLAVGLGRVWTVDPYTPALNELDPARRSLARSVNLPTSNLNQGGERLDPSSLAIGDGVIWLTSYVKGELWRVDPSLSSVTATIPVGRGALGLAVDRDGVWVANSLEGTVTRVDPRTNKVVATIALGHLPSWVAIGGGRVWISVQA